MRSNRLVKSSILVDLFAHRKSISQQNKFQILGISLVHCISSSLHSQAKDESVFNSVSPRVNAREKWKGLDTPFLTTAQ